MDYPWRDLYTWRPFKIDALGIITLLGSEEIDAWVGRLVPSRWLEYMPLLAINVVATNQFLRKQPSFFLYNVTKGIHTTDMAAWFTRWIQCQQLEPTRTVICWEEQTQTSNQRMYYHLISAGISFCSTGFLVVLTVLSHDFYGLATACALIVSILARAYLLNANRSAIDRAIIQQSLSPSSSQNQASRNKILIITPDSNILTMYVPGNLIIPVFIRNPIPSSPKLYDMFCWVAWAAFCVQVITLGMAVLATQMYVVLLITMPSMLICRGFGCDDTVRPCEVKSERYGRVKGYTCQIGSRLKATVFEWPECMEFANTDLGWGLRGPSTDTELMLGRSTKRMDLFAWLNLTDEEEESMSRWDLLPHQRGDDSTWQDNFKAKRSLVRETQMDIWDVQKVVVGAIRDGRNAVRDCENGAAFPSGEPKVYC
ncbi:uncharacterized protein BO88DRAFT_433646 [Aspergillus vadensis CBS 113365]|uniref:Uncharacterized protein n=1 Tax=Aspergillus vadensis (strain CBS 113365 / IMI 142717 / IBT 24658) TaxID=1448311 RepID=A0A319BHT4_ASPVC|nr:hypothetical protein BO88DRAFT_433646 [Aspergillus vadensis CBS 113365]PYH71694.1 hypothetical protein BO88DRAFT_433646 [Aspergillus vadensis CBS 113365]